MWHRRRVLKLAVFGGVATLAGGVSAACGGIEQSEFNAVTQKLNEVETKAAGLQQQFLSLQEERATAVGPTTQTFQIALGEVKVVEEVDGEDVFTGESHRWEPDVLVVTKGDKVVLEVLNPRKQVHSLVLKEFGVDTGELPPRTGKATVEFVADKAGVFQFECGIDPAESPYKDRTDACELDHKYQLGSLLVLER